MIVWRVKPLERATIILKSKKSATLGLMRTEDLHASALARLASPELTAIMAAVVLVIDPWQRKPIEHLLRRSSELRVWQLTRTPCPDLLIAACVNGSWLPLVIIDSKIAGAWVNWGKYRLLWRRLSSGLQAALTQTAGWWTGMIDDGADRRPLRFAQTDAYAGELEQVEPPQYWPGEVDYDPAWVAVIPALLLLPTPTSAAAALAETVWPARWAVLTADELRGALTACNTDAAAALAAHTEAVARPLHADGRRACCLLSGLGTPERLRVLWDSPTSRDWSPEMIGPSLDTERRARAVGAAYAVDRSENHPVRLILPGLTLTTGFSDGGLEVAVASLDSQIVGAAGALLTRAGATALDAPRHAEAAWRLPKVPGTPGHCGPELCTRDVYTAAAEQLLTLAVALPAPSQRASHADLVRGLTPC